MYRLIFFFVLILNVYNTTFGKGIIRDVLDSQVRQIMTMYDLTETDIGVYVKSLANTDVIYEKNASSFFIPASNQKLITTAAALIVLGPDFRFETKFLTDGKVENGILKGNVYIDGGFNPEIEEGYFQEFVTFLRSKGVREIDGNIYAISTHDYYPQGWPENDLNYCFTAKPSVLPISENCLRVKVVANKTLNVKTSPDAFIDIFSDVKLSRSRTHLDAKFQDNKLYITGYMSPNSSEEFSIPIQNPPALVLFTLAKSLQKYGIKYRKMSLTKETQPNLRVLYSIKSSPLREVIKKANKDSNNFIAEQLYLFLGKERILKTFEKTKLSSYLQIFDGSGLSKYNRVSPKALGEVLDFMYKTPYFEDFFQSLSVVGIDGTLRHRFSDKDLVGKIYAKTGYIKGVKNLSGYVISKDGQVYIFSVLINNLKSTKPANELQENICKILVNSTVVTKGKDRYLRF